LRKPAARRLIGRAAAGLFSAALICPLVGALGYGAASATTSAPNIDWLVSSSAINLINGYLGNSTLTQSAFDNPNTVESDHPHNKWTSQAVVSFYAYGPANNPSSFEYAIANDTIPAGTVYVKYDDESWSLTPPAEQEDPGDYMAAFVQLAHENGYKAILTPAMDLTTDMSCYDPYDPSWANYLYDCDIPALASEAEPDIFEIQAQSTEDNTSGASYCGCYQWIVQQAAYDAGNYNDREEIFAGLSSDHDGNVSTGSNLYSDVVNTLGAVDGYWLNAPVAGTACPACTPGGAPQVAAQLLWDLGYIGPGHQSISFGPAPPATVEGSIVLSATGGESGNPVSFSVDPSSTPGACSLASDGVTLSYTGVGNCVVDANEAGATNWLAAPRASETIPIAPLSQYLAFTPPAAAVVGGATVLIAAPGASGTPVTFSLDATSTPGACSLAADGVTLSYTGAGSCIVDANEAAGGIYGAAPQVTATVSVGPGPQALTFSPTSSAVAGTSATLSATPGASGVPVEYSVDPSSGAGVCSTSGPDGSVVTFSAVGSCVIDGNEAADVNYLAAPSVSATITVGPGTQSLSFTAPSGAAVGESAPLLATGGDSTSPIVFSVDPSSSAGVCNVSGLDGGTVNFAAAGECVIDVNQASDANFEAAQQVVASFVVGQGEQTISFIPPSTAPYGTSTVLSATGGGSSSPVVFSIDPSSGPGACQLAADGVTLSFTGTGSCIVDASQAGDANYLAAPTEVATIEVGLASDQISFTPPDGAVFGGSTVLSAIGGGSSSSVVFSVDPNSTAGACQLGGDGVTLSYTGVGNCVIDANQAGDTNYDVAPQVSVTIPVLPAAQQITFSPPAAGDVGGTTELSASGGSSGNPVVFTLDSSSTPGACQLGADDTTLTYTGVGGCIVDASEAGNTDYLATTTSATIAIAPGSQTITVTAPASAPAGTSADLNGSGGASGAPVVFSLDTSTGAGVCSLGGPNGSEVTFSAAGTCVVDANQAGDANYQAAPTVLATITVIPGSQTIVFLGSVPAAAVGESAVLSASGGASANPVDFSVDSSTATGVCSVSGAYGASISFTGAGSCVIDANQAGSANYNAAPTVSESIVVQPGSQAITFTSLRPDAAHYAGHYTPTATGGASGNPVVFGSETPSVCTLSDGEATYVGVGTCTIDANEAGNANYNAAPDKSQSFPVGQAGQAITVTSTPPPSAAYGGTYPLVANGGGSANSVTFASATSSVCTVTGTTASFVGVGTCTIDANQAGNTDYSAAPQVTQSFNVGQASQAITITSRPPASGIYGGTYSLAAIGGGSGNSVAFTSATVSVCTVSGTMASFVGVGTCMIDANQAGNTDYTAAPQAIQSFTVGQVTQAITFTSTPPSSAAYGGIYPLAATGGGSGNAVAFASATTAVCTVSGTTATLVGVGTCTIDASQAGNTDYTAAPQAIQSFTVGQASQAITFTSHSPASAIYGGTYSIAATGGASGSAVTFASATTAVCTVTGATASFVGVGTCTIDANQAGTTDYMAAAQATQIFTVGPASQKISLSSSGGVYGSSEVVGATGGPSGNPVTITSATTSVCTVTGTTATFVGAGTCTIDANQAGNTDYSAAPQVQATITVAQATQAITFNAPTTPTYGQLVTLSATGGASGNAVAFTSTTTSVCTVTGTTATFVGAGTCTIDANQAGNTDYSAAPQVRATFTVAKAAQTVTFTSTAPTSATYGQGSYTVAATGGGSGVSVTFSTLTRSICVVTGATVTFVGAGYCNVQASEAGNANYLAASAQQGFSVSKATQKIAFTSKPPTKIVPGGTYTVAATGGGSGIAVIFSSGSTSVCTVTGSTGSTVTFVAAGTCTIDANEAGNADYYSTTNTQKLTVS
jgi:hypothetical protein